MIVKIQIIDEDTDSVLWEAEKPANQPMDFKTHPERPLRWDQYALFGYTFQPIIKIVPR